METKITKEDLNNEYIVLEVKNPNHGTEYVITKRDNFKTTPYYETYNNYGINNDSTCCCDWDEEDDGHWEVLAWTFSDGSNFKSIIIEEEQSEFEEVSEKLAEKILKEMPNAPYINGITKTIETKNYSFCFSRYSDNPWICSVV